ncbi:MAG: 3D domain-containing protein [Oscillospiraceae bacterium]
MPKLFRTQSAPAAKSAQAETAIVTPLALETVALPVKEEAVTEEPLAEEASGHGGSAGGGRRGNAAPEADNAIARATKADHERPDDLVKLGDFIATAYCVTGQTSTGTQTTVGRTLAVNPYVIPYGTEVWLYLEDGTFAGDFIAEDTGSNMLANPNVIDIYMGQDSYNDCILWGAQNVEVYIRATAESETAQ